MLSNRTQRYPERVAKRPPVDPDGSVGKMVEMIGERKRVLDLGCGDGSFAMHLTQRECDVVGIDLSPVAVEAARAYCTRAIVADLDGTPLSSLVDGASFDAIVCAGVLEHLRYPTRLLEEARAALRPGGFLIAAIPNVAHGAVRLKLLDGSFDYRELGILDDANLRFFTAKTVDELFVCAGYRVESMDRTRLPLFEPSTLVPPLIPTDYKSEIVESIRRDPECETLQFVVKASPLADDLATRAIAKRYLAVNTELANARVGYERLNAELTSRIDEGTVRLEGELGEALTALEAATRELDASRRTASALRDRLVGAERLNVALVSELYAALDAQRVSQATLEELEGVREDVERERARYRTLAALFVRHLGAAIDRTRTETTDLATRIDQIQTGRIWRFKNALRRIFKRGAAV
ncbi:MAG TPA: methyltransferase domain-containing protein [Candidatus Baltobacteraceae bacterium]